MSVIYKLIVAGFLCLQLISNQAFSDHHHQQMMMPLTPDQVDETDAQLRAKADQLRPLVGDEIYNHLLENLYTLNGCRVSSSRPSRDPDAGGGISLDDLVAPRAREVLGNWREYGSGTTTRQANHAIKNYSRDSIRQDQNFMLAAFRFYRAVKRYDERHPFPNPSTGYASARTVQCDGSNDVSIPGPGRITNNGSYPENPRSEVAFDISPIDVSANIQRSGVTDALGFAGLGNQHIPSSGRPNFYHIALQAAGGNAYQAMRILQVYGHDNMQHSLFDAADSNANDCRFAIMDSVMTFPPSRFYQNGAIGGSWSNALRDEGKSVANNCYNAHACMERRYGRGSFPNRYYSLCNDGKASYEGDYYHVLAGAYARCRGDVAANQGRAVAQAFSNPLAPLASMLPSVFGSFTDSATLVGYDLAVKAYKIARFVEEIRDSGIGDDRKRYLYTALGLMATTNLSHSQIADNVLRLSSYSPQEERMLKSIMHRHHFEINFRQRQHRIGARIGHRACGSQATFNPGSLATAVSSARVVDGPRGNASEEAAVQAFGSRRIRRARSQRQ